MTCANCQRHAQSALEGVPGVFAATVNLESKEAVVEHDETVTAERLIAAVDEEGYAASAIG